MQGDILSAQRPHIYRLPPDDVVLVASAHELDGALPQRFVYVEHGAGQNYLVKESLAYFYSGGVHPPNVIGYVCPNAQVAARWNRPSVVVGCPPLDHHTKRRSVRRQVAAITFHWNGARICPEAGSARDHYLEHLPMIVAWLREHGYHVVGHWHPRDDWAWRIWDNLRVDTEPDPDVILREASLLIADNTSLLFEACALGIKTIVLNAPWYRRDVHHGLRFWDTVPGVMVDDAFELVACAPDVDHSKRLRDAAAKRAYHYPAGSGAGRRAADWVLQQVG